MGAEASRRLNFVLLGRRLARGHRLPASSLLQLSLPDEPRHTDHGLVALMRRSCLLGLAVLAPLSLASAHAFLERANPLVGSEIAASPPELSITFTEGVMMPGEDGLSVCRRLRANGTIPIIMLTAKGSEFDRVAGLEIGADDYLSSIHELLARVRAVLRRTAMPLQGSPAGARRVFEFAGWRLDVSRRELRSPANALVDLRAAEFDVLLALVEHPQRVLTRDQLLDLARGRATTTLDRTIDLYISWLRHRLEADPKEPALIKTMRSEGYIFTADVTLNGAPW